MCEVRGVVVRGVLRSHQADVPGDCCQCGKHGLGVGPAHNIERVGTPKMFAEAEPFTQEEGCELASLRGLGDVAERLEVRLRAAWGAFQMVPELTPWKKIPN